MNSWPFDLSLPFEAFAPFAPFCMLAPPAQRWLDILTDAPQAMFKSMAMGLQDATCRRPLAGWPDPFKATAGHANAPAVPPDLIDTCSRASCVMSKALTSVTQRHAELCRSWLAAQERFAPAADTNGLHVHIKWLHAQTAQAMAQLRGITDEYLEAWFTAAAVVADAWPAAALGDTADHDQASIPASSKTKPTACRTVANPSPMPRARPNR